MSTNSLFVQRYQDFGTFSPMSLGENVKKFREQQGLSQAKLAKAAGFSSQNSIVAIEAGGRTTRVPQLARALKVKVHELDPDAAVEDSVTVPPAELGGARDLKLYASVDAGEGAIVVTNEPVDWITRPAPLANVRDAYGVIVTGESMVPLYRPGETALVHPHIPPRVDDVCIFINDADGVFHATIKEYRGQTKDLWKVMRYGPEKSEFTLRKKDWPKVHVVVGKYCRR